MALDDLSSGRIVMGIGAGWMRREHTLCGTFSVGPASDGSL